MKYDFDKLVDRTGSNDVKHEELQTIWGRICYHSGWQIWILRLQPSLPMP